MRASWEAERVQARETAPADPVTESQVRENAGDDEPEVRETAPARRTGRDRKSYPVRAPKTRVELDEPAPEDDEEPATPTFEGLPGYGPALVEAAKEVAHARAAVAKIAQPHSYAQSVASSLKSVEANLRYGVPEVCPRCSGTKCIHCRERGWVEKSEGDGLRASVKAMAR